MALGEDGFAAAGRGRGWPHACGRGERAGGNADAAAGGGTRQERLRLERLHHDQGARRRRSRPRAPGPRRSRRAHAPARARRRASPARAAARPPRAARSSRPDIRPPGRRARLSAAAAAAFTMRRLCRVTAPRSMKGRAQRPVESWRTEHDRGRLSQGQVIAAVGAVVLLIAMFLPWMGFSAGVEVGRSPSLGAGSCHRAYHARCGRASEPGQRLEGLDARHLPADHGDRGRFCPLCSRSPTARRSSRSSRPRRSCSASSR